jgi:hypothetical protein
VFGPCEDGGGVMEEVARGVGDMKPVRSGGDAAFDILAGVWDIVDGFGVFGRATSVVGSRESCDGCRDGCLSILLGACAVAAERVNTCLSVQSRDVNATTVSDVWKRASAGARRVSRASELVLWIAANER